MTIMINKVVYGQTVLLDLTSDTVTAEHLDSGYTAHDANGAVITGTSTKNADTSDATASAADILSGQTAYAVSEKLIGTMPNNGAVSGTISTASDSYAIPEGYHDGSGSVSIVSAEQAKIIPENIKSGVSILGVAGSHSGSADTVDATASADYILSGQTAYVNGEKLTGTMVNNGAVSGTISKASDSYAIPKGYHDGNGSVSIASAEQAKIISENIKSGVSILGVTGSHFGGTDTSDATASAADILSGQTAYAVGEKLTGTMANRGAVSGTISTVSDSYSIPAGYHDGSGSVSIASAEQAKIIPENIKSGVSILGVAGSHSGTADTFDATASAADILSGQTAYVAGEKLTGTMANNGSVTETIATKSGIYTVPAGYHDGSGSVSIASGEQAKIIPENIKSGVSILGVTGTLGAAFDILTPIAFDFANGYVAGASGWIYQANSNNRADVYQVTKDHTYFCRLGDTVSERWRGCFTTANPVTATGDLSGSCVVFQNEDSVPKRACFAYKPRVDGYITIVKTRSGINNIPTYMYDITGFDPLLSYNAVTGLSVTSAPAKTVYDAGEIIDYTGMVVTATYSDDSTADVTNFCIVTPRAEKVFDPSTDTNVSITYKDTTTSLTLTTATLTGISVTRKPSKATYKPGENVDYTDMVVTATYSNGSTADVTKRCICSPAQGELVSDTVTITYTYGSNSKSCTLNLTVAQYQLNIYSLPTKTTYTPGEDLDITGAIVDMFTDRPGEFHNVTPFCLFVPVVDGDRTIVTVSCAPPKVADITGVTHFFVNGSTWEYRTTQEYPEADFYHVLAGHEYFLYAGVNAQNDSGVFLDALFTTADVPNATSDISGVDIVQDNERISGNRRFTYTPASDGYIGIISFIPSGWSTAKIPSYLYDAENPNRIITTTFTLTTVNS